MNVYTKRQRIAKIAKQHPEEPITLLHHYIDEEWVTASFYFLPKDKAPGIDQQTWQQYEENLEENIKSLPNRAKSGSYKAPPVRRTKIPKPGSKEERKLGIPTTEDKVLQKAALMLLEPIYELEFLNFSFGFRRGKSQHQALEYLWKGYGVRLDVRYVRHPLQDVFPPILTSRPGIAFVVVSAQCSSVQVFREL